tara:strand:- start:1267 stop:1608 length:342 start_codon:yes stop_codon:yes gene_type:complete
VTVYKIWDILTLVVIMKFINVFFITLLIIISSCKAIEKKSQEAIDKENKKLSQFIQQSVSTLKIEMGLPDEITHNNGSTFYVYKKKKYSITCERKFEINKNKIVIGFSSKGCF